MWGGGSKSSEVFGGRVNSYSREYCRSRFSANALGDDIAAVYRSFPFTTRGIIDETHSSFHIPAPNNWRSKSSEVFGGRVNSYSSG